MTFTAKINWNRWGKWAALLVLATGAAVGAYALDIVAHHNFHTVSEGRIYRSAQMGGEALAGVVREHGIKSIINLRGGGAGDDWYRAETNVSSQLGVRHFDFALSATHEVTDEEMDRILETIRTAPKPALIHCKSGADRTGLVGALYLYSIEGRTARSADGQLNPFYGHLPFLFWSGSSAMDRSYWRYVHRHPARKRNPAPQAVVAENPAQ